MLRNFEGNAAEGVGKQEQREDKQVTRYSGISLQNLLKWNSGTAETSRRVLELNEVALRDRQSPTRKEEPGRKTEVWTQAGAAAGGNERQGEGDAVPPVGKHSSDARQAEAEWPETTQFVANVGKRTQSQKSATRLHGKTVQGNQGKSLLRLESKQPSPWAVHPELQCGEEKSAGKDWGSDLRSGLQGQGTGASRSQEGVPRTAHFQKGLHHRLDPHRVQCRVQANHWKVRRTQKQVLQTLRRNHPKENAVLKRNRTRQPAERVPH